MESIENILHDFDEANRGPSTAVEIKDYWRTVNRFKELISQAEAKAEEETKFKLLGSINSFLAEKGITDIDGTPLTFSPEEMKDV